jgi:mannitol-specific phosphotransferase system IIBC component
MTKNLDCNAAKKIKDGFSVVTNNMDDKIYLFICILKIKIIIFCFPFEAKWINY